MRVAAMTFNRRNFLSALGFGATVAAVIPAVGAPKAPTVPQAPDFSITRERNPEYFTPDRFNRQIGVDLPPSSFGPQVGWHKPTLIMLQPRDRDS